MPKVIQGVSTSGQTTSRGEGPWQFWDSYGHDKDASLNCRFTRTVKTSKQLLFRPERAVSVAGKHWHGAAEGHPAIIQAGRPSETHQRTLRCLPFSEEAFVGKDSNR
jgi:hypothetical protein